MMRSVRSFLDSLLAVESMRYKNLGQRNCGMEDPTQRSACFAERRTCLVRGEGLCRARRGEGCQGRGDGKTWRPIWHLTPFIDTRAPTATPCIDSSGSVSGALRKAIRAADTSRKETRRSGPVGPLSPLARWIPGTRVSDN